MQLSQVHFFLFFWNVAKFLRAFLAIFKNYSILIFLKNILVVITTRVLNNFSKTTNAIYFDQTYILSQELEFDIVDFGIVSKFHL